MSPPCEPQPTRALLTAAELVNEEIRAFMRAREGRPLHTDESQAYQQLLTDRIITAGVQAWLRAYGS